MYWGDLENIMREFNFPHQFIKWTMLTVRIVFYKFQINGVHSYVVAAKRGLRLGDPLSPLLLVVVMEYLQRVFQNLKNLPDFNFHSKCEKLGIINLSFADDLLLFSRGD